MPDSSIDVYFTLKDGGSAVLAKIGDQTKSLDKETQRLAQSYAALKKANEPLIKQQTELEKQLAKANKEAKDAEKAFKKLGDAASEDAFDKAKEKQNDLRDALASTKAMIQENERAYKSTMDTIRKSAAGETSLANITFGLAASGVGQQLSNSLGGVAQSVLASEIGIPAASAISETISGAISGAAAGSVLGPWGALAGAALGGVSGAISGQTTIFEAEDDAFKSYYNELYENVNTGTSESVSTGSDIAADREMDAISFATLFGGQEEAASYLKSMVEMANYTPFQYDDLKSMSKTMKTYGWDTDEMTGDLTTIGDTGAALGMDSGDMNTVATALGRMRSSDKTSLEYLNMLTERGINAVGILAEARGRSVADTYSDISGGKIDGSDAVEIILAAMEKSFSGSMEEQSKTFSGLSSTLEGLEQEIDNAAGVGYNEERKGGIQDEIDALGGPLGEALSKVAEISGQNQAYLENLSDQYQREALSAVLLGEDTTLFSPEQQEELRAMADAYTLASEEYAAGSQEAGLKMESLMEEAQALATAAYDSSEFVKQAQDVQLEQIEAIRENTSALTGWKNSFLEQQELSKGQGTGIDWSNVLSTAQKAWDLMGTNGATDGYAYGLDYVPYDGFPAILHQGERVKTAAEARAEDAGINIRTRDDSTVFAHGIDLVPDHGFPSAGQDATRVQTTGELRAGASGSDAGRYQIIITGNSFQGTSEEMVDQMAEIFARRLEQADIAAAPR